MNPSTLGVLLLVLLVTFAEVRSYRRVKRFRREVARVVSQTSNGAE